MRFFQRQKKKKTYASVTNWDSGGDALRLCKAEAPVSGRLLSCNEVSRPEIRLS